MIITFVELIVITLLFHWYSNRKIEILQIYRQTNRLYHKSIRTKSDTNLEQKSCELTAYTVNESSIEEKCEYLVNKEQTTVPTVASQKQFEQNQLSSSSKQTSSVGTTTIVHKPPTTKAIYLNRKTSNTKQIKFDNKIRSTKIKSDSVVLLENLFKLKLAKTRNVEWLDKQKF